MHLSEFDYHLPPELIAQQPLPDRADSRMLVLDRRSQTWEDRRFRDLPEHLGPGDCLILNNSRVIPSRLFGSRAGVRSLAVGKRNPRRFEHLSGKVEVLLLRPLDAACRQWQALVRPGRKMRTGEIVRFEGGVEAEIVGRGEFGERTLRFTCPGDFYEWLDKVGHVPLPPYVKRPDEPGDRERYQTVYARDRGSVAAPTAGLHFTPEVLEGCSAAGATTACVTLHVGLGTFQPLHDEEVEQNHLHHEWYSVDEEVLETIRAAARRVAVGTTSVRTLESALRKGPRGETDLFIYPGYEFQGVDAMLTNFHLPRTSLLLLVCAFAGTPFALAAYRHAVEQRYRFFSYGDCMLIL
ncbi:MAG: tRNA preQ1(34) S-adenosylmethionine ribosyltransferase-isomerase QueA [Bryobacterales bacterium]|nr:tRNA preQ1(34) S-adenosylmethionine ribosyltransferase-isomerase QueA [Bryobacterales bacterium]